MYRHKLITQAAPTAITPKQYPAHLIPLFSFPETCQASVVFGLGKNKFVTEVMESNNPEWNQEAVMYVGSSTPRSCDCWCT